MKTLTRVLLLASLNVAQAGADIVVIVNAANPVRSMNAQQVAALYLGRTRSFPNGDYALVFDQPRDSPQRAGFSKRVAKMSLGQFNAYWSRLTFSGQETPPQTLPSEQAMLDIVRRNPSAIGYLSSPPADGKTRVVLHLKE